MPLRTIGYKIRPQGRGPIALPAKRVDPFYTSPEWRALIATIKQRRGARCEDPTHLPEHPRLNVRIYGDHITELKDGGQPLDPKNIMLRCPPCHQRKTAEHRRQRYHR